jgi:hypothetical protein
VARNKRKNKKNGSSAMEPDTKSPSTNAAETVVDGAPFKETVARNKSLRDILENTGDGSFDVSLSKIQQDFKKLIDRVESNPSVEEPPHPVNRPFFDYLTREAARIAKNYEEKKVSSEDQQDDRNAAIQHMYDSRRDFVENSNRYYTRYLIAFAAILYGLRFAVEAKDPFTAGVLFLASGGMCIALLFYVMACKALLRSIYYLYSSSVITAATKSLATGDWSHSWFDKVAIVAKDELAPKYCNHWGFGTGPQETVSPSIREVLANKWSSEKTSLLAIDSRKHDWLCGLLFFLGVIGIICGVWITLESRNASNSKDNQTGKVPSPSVVVLSSKDLEEQNASVEKSLKSLLGNLEASTRAVEVISQELDNRTGPIDEKLKSLFDKSEKSTQAIEAISRGLEELKIIITKKSESLPPPSN